MHTVFRTRAVAEDALDGPNEPANAPTNESPGGGGQGYSLMLRWARQASTGQLAQAILE